MSESNRPLGSIENAQVGQTGSDYRSEHLEESVNGLTANYRVIETRDAPPLSIQRVIYNTKGEPIGRHTPDISAFSGDGLTFVLNEIALALTKPSLLESDFKSRPRLLTPPGKLLQP